LRHPVWHTPGQLARESGSMSLARHTPAFRVTLWQQL
jgi:hypothetical protein